MAFSSPFFLIIAKVKKWVAALGELIEGFNKFREKALLEYLQVYNALLCGFINALLSLLQTVVMLLSFVIRNLPGMGLKNLSPSALQEQQKRFAFFEDFVDVVSEFFMPVVKGIQKFFSKSLENLEKGFDKMMEFISGANLYDWSFVIGGFFFEILFDLIIGVLTGGGSIPAQIQAKFARITAKFASLGKKAVATGAKVGAKAVLTGKKIITAIKTELKSLVKALQDGRFWEFLVERFKKVFGKEAVVSESSLIEKWDDFSVR